MLVSVFLVSNLISVSQGVVSPTIRINKKNIAPSKSDSIVLFDPFLISFFWDIGISALCFIAIDDVTLVMLYNIMDTFYEL